MHRPWVRDIHRVKFKQYIIPTVTYYMGHVLRVRNVPRPLTNGLDENYNIT